MSRHRLTPRKKRFVECVVEGMTLADAARTAGYAVPEVKGPSLMAKTKDGRLKDRSIAAYMTELAEAKTPEAPAGRESIPVDADVAETGDAAEVVGQVFSILRNASEPGGTRLKAAELLLKHLGADRPTDSREKDAEAAARAIKSLLGIREDDE